MKTVYLYNESFFFFGKLKHWLKKARGPEAVFKSLVLGFKELEQNSKINAVLTSVIESACVLSGTKTLDWVIGQKQKGLIKKIIAGPNLVIAPNDAGGIIKHPLVDKIVVPCQWVKDFYISLAPELTSKIHIWASGVNMPQVVDVKKEYDFLIFAKNYDHIFDHILEYLKEKKYSFNIVFYGKFTQEEYFYNLNLSKNLIYLSESESQGLAMFEAWARNVPTLVWDRGFMEYGKHRWQGNTSAPYLSQSTGLVFKNFENFKDVFSEFISQQFSPREWVKNNATNKIAAQKYLDIINA